MLCDAGRDDILERRSAWKPTGAATLNQHYTIYQPEQEEMATAINLGVVNLALVLVLVSLCASDPAERVKTVEFNVKPGGVVHTFTEAVVSDWAK